MIRMRDICWKRRTSKPEHPTSSIQCRNRCVLAERWMFDVSLCHRQFNRKPAPLPHVAAHGDPPAVRLDDVLDDAQADPHPLRLAAQLRAAAVKAFENLLVFVCRN